MPGKRVIIVEDEGLIAAEIKFFLQRLGYIVVGHAMNGDKALDLFASTACDIILLDIHIKGNLDGIGLAKIIKERYQIPFVFLTSFSDKATLDEVKETNPYGYILKPFSENDLLVNIELALDKFKKEVAERKWTKSYLENKLKVELTDREYEVLIAFNEGLTYKETGDKLFVSINTVKTYQKRLFQLFNVKNKVELLVLIKS